MGRMKRWSVGIFSHLDSAVSKIENHDALVTVAIRDAESARSRARVQLQRVQRDGDRMRRQLDEITKSQEQWRERAVRVGKEDEARALECLRRMKKAESQGPELEAQLAEHEKARCRLSKDIETIAERIDALARKRNLLRTRQSRADALRATDGADGIAVPDIDDILERWEINVTTSEACSDVEPGELDDLEVGFQTREEEEDLRGDLAALLEREQR
jgi:phage shock protein A